MDRFKLSIKDKKPGMQEVTEINVYWWSYLYWSNELKDFMLKLKDANGDQIGFYRYCVVEAKTIILDLYKKITSEGYDLPAPEWMDEFLNSK